MDSFLENAGLMAISFLIIYIAKKISEHYYFKQSSLYESDKIYKAADEFIQGASFNDVKAILEKCLDFDEEDIEKILSQSIPHRTDKDGGYRAFMKTVNKVFGEDVYGEHCHT